MSEADNNEIIVQPRLDDNHSRLLDPKTQKEFKGAHRFYNTIKNEDGRYVTAQVLVDMKDCKKILVFGHLELEREFADEQLQRTLTQIEGIKR